MSVSRKDWSALSSLAKQRSVEDEEEWERERRRRHRNLSFTTSNEESPKLTQNGDGRPADRLPSVEETEARTPPPPASKNEDEDFQAILRTRQERRQRRQAVEAVQSPIQERLKAEESRDSSDPGQVKQQPPVSKKELDAPPRRRLSREQRGPWAQEEESLVGREPGEGKKGAPEKTPVSEKTFVHEKTSAFEKRSISNEKTSLSEKTPGPEKTPVSEMTTVSEKRSDSEKRLVPERTRVLEKTPALEKTPTPEKISVSEKMAALDKRSDSEKRPVPERTRVLEKTSTLEKTPTPEKTSVSEEMEVSEKQSISEKKSVPERTGVSEKTPTLKKTLTPEKTSVSEKIAISEKRCTSEKKAVPERTSFSEKTLTPEKPSSLERRKVSEKAAIFEKTLASEKTPTTEMKLTLKRAVASEQPQEQLTSEGAQLSTKEQRRRVLPEKSPPPSAEPREQGESDSLTLGSHLPAFTLQVKVPSKEEEADITSPTQATYSSSLRRSSSRTISFRMRSRKDNSETTLTRSASMRLPASSVKLGEKLEKYQMAIQRSEALKSPGSTRTEFFVAPVGVSSKRHLFEKVLPSQSQAEPASSRKENLRLSGVVTSRLNLWISRTQESGDQDPQEVQKELAASKRTSWGKKSDPPLDVEV